MECFRPSREASTQKYADSSTGLGKVTFSLGSTAMARWMAWIALALPDHPLINIAELIQLSSCKQTKKKNNLQKNLRATPLETSQLSMLSARLSASSDPSKTSPNPPINIWGIFYLIVNILTLLHTVHHFAPSDAASVVERNPSGAAEGIADAILDGHVCIDQSFSVKLSSKKLKMIDDLQWRQIRRKCWTSRGTDCPSRWRRGDRDSARHSPTLSPLQKIPNVKDTKSLWKKLIASTSDGSIESQGNGDSSPLIRVQDPGLRSDYQTVLARLFDPLDVIAVLNGDVVR